MIPCQKCGVPSKRSDEAGNTLDKCQSCGVYWSKLPEVTTVDPLPPPEPTKVVHDGVICHKCSYQRTEADPLAACPKCGVVYSNAKRYTNQQVFHDTQKASTNKKRRPSMGSAGLTLFLLILFFVAIIAISSHGANNDRKTYARFQAISLVIDSLKIAVEMYCVDDGCVSNLTSDSSANLNKIGYDLPPLPPEISSISMDSQSVITAIIAPGVIGSTSCGNVTYTPTFDKTKGAKWAVTTTCPEPAQSIVRGWVRLANGS